MNDNLKLLQDDRADKWLGNTIYLFDEIDSTNRWFQDQHANIEHGSVALAELQTAGRGRLGRKWTTPKGGAILMSIFLRPKWPVERLQWLTMISGIAAADSLSQISKLPIQLKWPNDIVLNNESTGEMNKVGGILTECAFAETTIDYAIIGMGLNINLSAEQLPSAVTPASSLLAATGRIFDRRTIVNQLLDQLADLYTAAELGRSPQPLWQTKLLTVGKEVTVSDPIKGQSWIGLAVGTNDWGQLIVQDQTGQKHTISAADVTLRSN